MTPIYHLALRDEWDRAIAGGDEYRRSTIGRSLDDVGFIHCSFAAQVETVADLFYRGRDDVLLLVIDPVRLTSPLRVEPAPGTDQQFPHVYGPLPADAVTMVRPVPRHADGRLDFSHLVEPSQ